MPFLDQPYTILLIMAVGIAAALAVAVLKYRPTLGTHAFAVLMGSVAVWALLTIFEVASYDYQTKIFSGNLKYLFIAIIPVAWFVFSLFYANRIRTLKTAWLLLLAAVPTLTVFMVATNPYHHLMFSDIKGFRSGNFYLIARRFGPWFWVHTTYSYTLLLLGFALIAKSLIDSQRLYRRQVISLLVAALAPWICNVLFLTGAQPFPKLDLTPFAFSVSGLALMWGIIRYRLLDVVPVARDLVLQNMQDGIVVIDNDKRILDLNPTAAKLVGVQPAAVIGRRADQAISWWPRLSATDYLDETRPPASIAINSNGTRQLLQVAGSALRKNEKMMGHLVILRDITNAMAAQEALRKSEERFKSISENAPIIIFALDDSGCLNYVNPAWENILGHKKMQVLGQPFTAFIAETHREKCTELFSLLNSGKQNVAENSFQMASAAGDLHTFDVTAAVNSDDEGRITGIIGLAKDITEENRLQTQLFQSQKMEAIGTLSGGIAHDFNNLLMGMQANISLLRLEPGGASAVHQEKLKRIEEQIQSGASLTRQLLGYARKGQYVISPVDIHQLIQGTLDVVQRTNKNIRIHRDLQAVPAILNADRGQLELILLNLFVNAVDAMPNGGELTVSTRRIAHTDLADRITDPKPGPYIEIQVADTGMGMDQSTIEHIFEPFFTTKEIGRGTGLGLASVYGAVQNHNGHIQVSSRAGLGSAFLLLFPATDNAVPKPKAIPPVAIPSTQERNVLIVDDEPPILEYIGEMAQSLGFSAILARGGQEAVEIFEAQGKTIDLVILDMVMPEMDGYAAFNAIATIDPDVRVIIASGCGLEERAEKILALGPHRYLKKPFTRDEMASAIAAVLGAVRPPLDAVGQPLKKDPVPPT